jgi:hypothetical protein
MVDVAEEVDVTVTPATHYAAAAAADFEHQKMVRP